MGRLTTHAETPHCPVCEGPCTEELERNEYVFPDRLPKAKDGSADPPEVKPKKKNRRGRRMRLPEHHAPEGPTEDRMVRPSEDR